MITTSIKEGLEPAVELMNRVLREATTVVEEFPLVFRSGFSGQVVSLGDESSVRSACAILLRDAVCSDISFKLGLIGSVSTDSDHRRTGLATNVLLGAEQRLAQQGAVISMLWADDPRFYFARGYRPVGSENDFLIDGEMVESLPILDGIRLASADDAEAIHNHYNQHPTRLERSREETAALLECPGMTTLVHEPDGQLLGYACMGRGEDLAGTVHEWGGDLNSVFGLLRMHAESRNTTEPTFLIAPRNETELAQRLTLMGSPPVTGLLGLAKIVNREAAAKLLNELVGDTATVTFHPEGSETEQVHIEAPGGAEFLNDDTLLVLLFSGKGERAETEAFGDHFGVNVDRLPLETFVWGLDSI